MKLENKNGFSIIEFFLILIVVSVIVFAGWLVYQNQNTTKDLSTAEIISMLQKDVPKEMPKVKPVIHEEPHNMGRVEYQVEGYDFKSFTEAKSYVEFTLINPVGRENNEQPDEDSKRNVQLLSPAKEYIEKSLVKSGFNQNVTKTDAYGATVSTYERNQDICSLRADSHTVSLSCSTKTELAKVSASIKPFIKAMRDGGIKDGPFALSGTGTGTTEKDKYVTIMNNYSAAFLYQKNGEWVYYQSSMDGIGCPDSTESPEAARAFSSICIEQPDPLVK